MWFFSPSELRYSSCNLILFIQLLFLTHELAYIIICFICLINHRLIPNQPFKIISFKI